MNNVRSRLTQITRKLAPLAERLHESRGQGMVEYGLVITLIAVAVIGALVAVGGQLGQVYTDVVTGLQGVAP